MEIDSNNNLVDYNIVGLQIDGTAVANMANLLGWLTDSGTGTNYGKPTHNKHN
jgi:hypothetical protein